MRAEMPPVVFTGPLSQYLNQLFVLPAQNPVGQRPHAASPYKKPPSDSPERVKSPPRPMSPPKPYAAPQVGTIITRKQLQLVSVAAVQSTPIFATLQDGNAALLQSLLVLKSEPQVKEAESTLSRWATLPDTSAFEYGAGRVLQPQDCYEVMKGTTGRNRVEVLRAVDILTKMEIGPKFSALKDECEKLAKARDDYFSKLKLFVAQQSKLQREKSKSSLTNDIPFLVPGPGLEDSKHTACLSKGKRQVAKSVDVRPQITLETAEFKLQMLKNIYLKQLLKVTFTALGLEYRCKHCLHGRVEEVQHRALLQVGYLAMAGWVHVMLVKSERKNILQDAQERQRVALTHAVFSILARYTKRKEIKQELILEAARHFEKSQKNFLLYNLRVAVFRKKRSRILNAMAADHARSTLLSAVFREFYEYVVSTMVIKEKIMQRTRLHSPARVDTVRHAEAREEHKQTYFQQLRALSEPRFKTRKCRVNSIPYASQAVNETMQAPKLQSISPQKSDPVLAKYLTATQRRVEMSPKAETLQVHKMYAMHKQRYSPEELNPPPDTATPEYWPVDVGLMATPTSPAFRQDSFIESAIETSIEESIDSLPSFDLRLDWEPNLNRTQLVTQIRGLWLYYRTLKRVGPTFHTLRARKALVTCPPEDVVKAFIYSRRLSKFFTNWKKAYLTRYLLRHLETFSALRPAMLSLQGLLKLAEQRRLSDSRASSMYEYKLKQKALEKWTSSGQFSDEAVYRYRLQRALNAWKLHQRLIVEKVNASIKARKLYKGKLIEKVLFVWSRATLREKKCKLFSEHRQLVSVWRFWLQKAQRRQLLRRVITQGLENYKDSTIEELRSQANLLTQILLAWNKLSCKKRKSRDSQLKTLTALNWRAQKTKVVVFFLWKERIDIGKGLKRLESYWSKKRLFCLRVWKDSHTSMKKREIDVETYHRQWLLQRIMDKWSEWLLQEKIVKAMRKRRTFRAWRAGIYQVKELPINYHKRRAAKTMFLTWKTEWEKITHKTKLVHVLTKFNGEAMVREKKRVLAKFITNWLQRSKSRRLKVGNRLCRLRLALHKFARKVKKTAATHLKDVRLQGKLHSFRLKWIQRVNPQIRVRYITQAFAILKQRFFTLKRVLCTFAAIPLKVLVVCFQRLNDLPQTRRRPEESLRQSAKSSEIDSLFRSLEDSYLKNSLYRDTRTRKVRFEGEMDTSSVGAKVQSICDEAQESWLDSCQRREQEKRAEIHRELDSLQASLLSSLSSRASRSGRFDVR